MNCKQIYIKDKQIKYYWKNTHKVEENGGELFTVHFCTYLTSVSV
jgi:hypothetical protein